MAMIKLGGYVDINGKLHGTIFRSDQCGPHAQGYPRQVFRMPSPKQRSRRMAFSWLWHTGWKKIAKPLAYKQWWRYCYRHPGKNMKGEKIFWTAFNAFVKVNLNRKVEGKPIFYYPPD